MKVLQSSLDLMRLPRFYAVERIYLKPHNFANRIISRPNSYCKKFVFNFFSSTKTFLVTLYFTYFPSFQAYLTKKGDFCVRAAEKKTGLEIILYVKGEKKIHQFEIKKEKDGYTIPPKPTKFKDMTELIQHFKNNAFAEESGLKLLEAAQRPKWYLKRNEIKIDKKLLGRQITIFVTTVLIYIATVLTL